MTSLTQVADWSRAIADLNRLRILLICAEKPAIVREIATIMRISDPLVSHHLAALQEAGLLERRRISRSVEYRVPEGTPAAQWVQQLLQLVDTVDPLRTADRRQRERIGTPPAGSRKSGFADRLERALLACASERLTALGARRSLRVCVESDRATLVSSIVADVGHAVAVASTAAHAATLRRTLRAVVAGDDVAVTTPRTLAPDARFDLVVVDALDRADANNLAEWLPTLTARLPVGKTLLLFVPYDALGEDQSAEHPLLRLRRTLSQHGMRCEQIQPIEAAGRHCLAAVATLQAVARSQVA